MTAAPPTTAALRKKHKTLQGRVSAWAPPGDDDGSCEDAAKTMAVAVPLTNKLLHRWTLEPVAPARRRRVWRHHVDALGARRPATGGANVSGQLRRQPRQLHQGLQHAMHDGDGPSVYFNVVVLVYDCKLVLWNWQIFFM